jgi:hypothetical protein
MKNLITILPFAHGRASSQHDMASNIKVFFSLFALLMLTACSQVVSVRYNMEVSVNDNGRIYTNSGVWQETVTEGFFFPGLSHKGDAIPVSIGKKGTLFLLVAGSEAPGSWAPTAFENAFYGSQLFGEKSRIIAGKSYRSLKYFDQLKEIKTLEGVTKELDCQNVTTGQLLCPFMVTFRDSSDPKSVVVLDPRDISRVFGAGVSLNPIRITVTRERVTTGQIQKVLPWLKLYKDTSFLGENLTGRNNSRPDVRTLLSCWTFSKTSIICGGF